MRPPRILLVSLCLLTVGQAQTINRGPYLQSGSPTGVIVKWRTDVPTESVVRYGSQPNSLNLSQSEPLSTTEHEVTVTGISPDTKYFYSIGTPAGPLAGGDNDHFFQTLPPYRPTTDSDDADTFVNNTGNISIRPATGASVFWSPPPWTRVGDAGADQRTPISALSSKGSSTAPVG